MANVKGTGYTPIFPLTQFNLEVSKTPLSPNHADGKFLPYNTYYNRHTHTLTHSQLNNSHTHNSRTHMLNNNPMEPNNRTEPIVSWLLKDVALIRKLTTRDQETILAAMSKDHAAGALVAGYYLAGIDGKTTDLNE